MIKTLSKSLPVMTLVLAFQPPVLAAQNMDIAEPSNSYKGLCDASAAIAIGNSHFLVGEDEGKKGECLYLYRKGELTSITEPCQFDFTEQLRDDPEQEIDIEGAARIRYEDKDRIYWITSHGRSKKGKLRPNRYRLFATDIKGSPESPKLEWVGRYDDLVKDMLEKTAWSDPDEKLIDLLKERTRLEDKKVPYLAPKERGLNIEGLAVSPDGKGLFVGLRNPLDEKERAIVLHIENPKDLVTKSDVSARFGTPFYLDLHGLGIRSMAQVPDKQTPDKKEYLIVAGSQGEESEPFKLFKWRSVQEDPVLIGKLDSGKGSSPEALVVYEGSPRIQILHDEGKKKLNGGTKCKDEEKQENKRFSDRWYKVE